MKRRRRTQPCADGVPCTVGAHRPPNTMGTLPPWGLQGSAGHRGAPSLWDRRWEAAGCCGVLSHGPHPDLDGCSAGSVPCRRGARGLRPALDGCWGAQPPTREAVPWDPGLSPPPMRLCHGAWGSAPVDAVGCPDPPKFPWGFQPLKSLIKASLYFFPGLGPCLWGVRARHWQRPCPPALGDGGPHPRSPHPEGTHLAGDVGEGAPPVLVPAMGGHLHTGAGMDTPGTVPQFLPHRDHLRTLGLGDPGVWEAMPA